MSSCCSQSGSNGPNSLACGDSSTAGTNGGGSGGSGGGEIMLFGVRVRVDPMRKSVSMNNLSEYVLPPSNNQSNNLLKDSNESTKAADDAAASGYATADDAVQHQSTGGKERKRGIAWTEEEHKLFLLGLQKVGKGDWRGISRNFVKTRTPTQVASHAQKYYLRQNNLNRRRRRASLFDLTTDSVTDMPMEEGKSCRYKTSQTVLPTSFPPAETSNVNGYVATPFPMTVEPVLLPVQVQNPLENMTLNLGDQVGNRSSMHLHPAPIGPALTSSATVDPNLNQRVEIESTTLSLRLSLSSDHSESSTRHSTFQVMPSFNNGDSIISVA